MTIKGVCTALVGLAFAIIGLLTFGAVQRKKGEQTGDDARGLADDRTALQKDRAATEHESSEDLYRDLTGEGK